MGTDANLKPCPFCGGMPEWVDLNETGGVRVAEMRMAIACSCGARMERTAMLLTREAWNRRGEPDDGDTCTFEVAEVYGGPAPASIAFCSECDVTIPYTSCMPRFSWCPGCRRRVIWRARG